MIGDLATNPPATVPGIVVVLLIVGAVGCVGWLVWDADARRRDMERREQWRRDQAAQEDWEALKRAYARRTQSTAPRSIP